MDIFGKKRIAELERELEEAKYERDKYFKNIADLTVKFEEMKDLKESEPEGCVRGPWCKACEFARGFCYTKYYGVGGQYTHTAYMCSKGKSCDHFVQKEIPD